MIDRKISIPQGSACASLESGFACELEQRCVATLWRLWTATDARLGQVGGWVRFEPPEAPRGLTGATLAANVHTFGHKSQPALVSCLICKAVPQAQNK